MSNSKPGNNIKSEKITYEEKIIYQEQNNLIQNFGAVFDSEKDVSTEINNLTYFLTEN